MEISNFERSQVLVQALPYIQKYYQKTIVIKYGGNAMINEGLKDAVMTDIVLLSLVGIHVVLVHGGGPEINAMLDRLGKESRFVGGLRYTDRETMDVVQMVLAGKVNKDLVQLLGAQEAPHILNLAVPGVRSQGLINALQERDIYVSAGSACSKGHRSHVLEAIGAPDKVIDGALRVSFSCYTTAEECAYFCEALAAARKELYPSL